LPFCASDNSIEKGMENGILRAPIKAGIVSECAKTTPLRGQGLQKCKSDIKVVNILSSATRLNIKVEKK